jgi:hypothetical protein
MLETGSLERRDAHLDLPPVTPPTEGAYNGLPFTFPSLVTICAHPFHIPFLFRERNGCGHGVQPIA